MAKIAVLGSTGFLGFYLTKELGKKNKLITYGFKKKSKYNLDLTKVSNVVKIAKLKPDLIINLIAETNLDYCEKKKFFCKKINFLITKNISEMCGKYNINQIYISTDQLYDDVKKNNHEKNTIIQNNYSKNKYLAEKIVLKNKGCVVRTNFFGLNKVNNKGLVNWLISNKGKTIFGYTNIKFSPLYIQTLVKILKKICNNFKPEIFNIGARGSVSKYFFLKQIINKNKLNIKCIKKKYIYDKVSKKAKRSKNMSMNVKKFEKTYKLNLPHIKNEISKIRLNA